MTEPTHVDGNAAAGAFAEVLGFDVTTATLTCGKCCRNTAFAESRVYHRGPGIVVRCPGCDERPGPTRANEHGHLARLPWRPVLAYRDP